MLCVALHNSTVTNAMLGIGKKRTDPADIQTPLREFIESNYPKENAQKLSQAIADVHNSRNKIVASLNLPEPDPVATVNQIGFYLSTLNMLTLRLV